MSTFIDLDSSFRDRDTYPNACSYEITPDQTSAWFPNARSVRNNPQIAISRPLEFVTTVRMESLQLPWHPDLVAIPKLYVEFRARSYGDRFLISTINSVHSETTFACVQEKVQTDSNGDPKWIYYRCLNEQTIRFKRKDSYVFKITTRNGLPVPFFLDTDPTIPADPNLQSLAFFTLTPFIRDGDYHNQGVEPISE